MARRAKFNRPPRIRAPTWGTGIRVPAMRKARITRIRLPRPRRR